MKRYLLHLLSCLVLLVGSVSFAAPATTPSTPSTTRPATPAPATRRPERAERAEQRHLAQLTRRSIELLEARKLDEAEKVLLEAIALDPAQDVDLYNLACLYAIKGKLDEALDYLQRSADAGYTDFIHLTVDPDLSALRELPRYKQLLAKRDLYQRKAAERAVLSLKRQFGDDYLYDVDEEDRLVFATNVDQETLDALKHALEAQAKSQWAQLFEHKPDEFITIVVPSPSDYKKIIRTPGVGGIYNDAEKILVAQHLGQVMTHEFTHALHAADRAPLEQDHPIWLAEGLASMFEAAQWQKDDKGQDILVPHDNYRLMLLQNAAHGDHLLKLEDLLKMQQPEFVKKATLAYGQSSSLLLYLYEQKLLKKFYDTYKAGFAKDESGRVALEQVTGQSLPALEKSWRNWMIHRPPPSMSTGPEGAFLGANLGGLGSTDVNDGVRIGIVLQNGPASKAGMKPGDVLVKIGEHDLHDFQSFGPIMNLFKPGDRVALRVRRDGKYLELQVVLGKRSAVLEGLERRPTRLRSTTRPAATSQTKPAVAVP